ncbi:thiamine pyrophosphate-binding protein [Amaricoccus macauensis]|uniref:thiamine pyrophosphate-binding protein n=1 Tax=Amaricoccus macauensis TaxID=57001 RepID=UPI003C7CEDC1
MSPRETIRAADALARRLHEAGCRHAFGIPGGEVLTLVDALERAGIRFTLVKHENAAGFMAEGVWHRTGAPGVMVATLGPGALNAVNVAANAEQDRVPLIVLTGCVDEDEALTYTHQVLDHQAVFRPVTKASFRMSAAGADTLADKALAIATEARPGPVHVDVPISVADAPCPSAVTRRRPQASPVAPAPGPDLERARQWLAEAERPVMIAGLDAVRDGAGAEIRAFAEEHGVPLVTSYKAKGLLPEDHAMALGGAGLSPKADALLLPFIRQADLVISAGYDPIEMRTGWREIWDPADTRVIEIEATPSHHYMHQAGLRFVADSAAGLHALREGVSPRPTWAGGEIPALKAGLAAAFPEDEAWGPGAVIAECREALPPETIATVDSGAHRILLSQMWRCTEPSTLLQSTGLCTMGCAVPLAIGAKIADPTRPVVSFSGDAGLLMIAGELATAAELNLPVIFVVFVDQSLALIELKQRQRQMGNAGVDFPRHDFAAIGRAFGGEGHTVTSRAELRTALDAALVSERFTVIAAEIDRQGYDGRI